MASLFVSMYSLPLLHANSSSSLKTLLTSWLHLSRKDLHYPSEWVSLLSHCFFKWCFFLQSKVCMYLNVFNLYLLCYYCKIHQRRSCVSLLDHSKPLVDTQYIFIVEWINPEWRMAEIQPCLTQNSSINWNKFTLPLCMSVSPRIASISKMLSFNK